MTNEEAAIERDRVRQEASEKASAERNKSTQQRVQEIKIRNAERSQQRESATNILTSGTANVVLSEIARQGGPLGRRLERDIRQFQQTGRVSSWLAGETLKAEAAQNAAQQSAFRQENVDVISIQQQPIQIGSINSYVPPLSLKPIIEPEGGGGGGNQCIGLALYVRAVGTTTQVWISAGTVVGQLPLGFDQENGKFIASGGGGYVWAKININETTGVITSVEVTGGASTPDNTNTSFYYALGYYQYGDGSASVTNFGCGSVDATICRNWYSSEPPYFSVFFQR